jgi:hypothetical protein
MYMVNHAGAQNTTPPHILALLYSFTLIGLVHDTPQSHLKTIKTLKGPMHTQNTARSAPYRSGGMYRS